MLGAWKHPRIELVTFLLYATPHCLNDCPKPRATEKAVNWRVFECEQWRVVRSVDAKTNIFVEVVKLGDTLQWHESRLENFNDLIFCSHAAPNAGVKRRRRRPP